MSAKKRKSPPPAKSNKNILIALGAVAAALFIYIVVTVSGGGGSVDASKATAAVSTGSGQEVTLDVSEYGYKPDVIKAKKGVPLTIRTNSTENAGCVRGLMIPDFGINKALAVGSDSFTFTPDKAGTFAFSCQMNMSKGTLIVEA